MSASSPAPAAAGGTLHGLAEHPDRVALFNEMHARPHERLYAPVQASHLALLSGVDAGESERALVGKLCARYGAHPPAPDSNHFSADFGVFRFRWERHTEFSTYTFFHEAPFRAPFADPPIHRVPAEWLARLPGPVLVATHVAIEPRDAQERSVEEVAALFAANTLAGSRVLADAARVWTDFRLHADGFGRILVQDRSLLSRQAGRLVQRLLEIETYRMAALLALPLARRHTPRLAALDATLSGLTAPITRPGTLQADEELLERLGGLAAEVEEITASTNYRFSAASAYHALVCRGIEDLREVRHEGIQTIGEFMDRRFTPAMRTCESTRAQLDALATRMARASNLLRTRVDIVVERQSHDLLRSMDRRARLQLRLQQTVEGLSVVVLSYYLVGLAGYALKGLKSAGLKLDVELLTGIFVPVAVILVLLGLRRLHRTLRRQEQESAPP